MKILKLLLFSLLLLANPASGAEFVSAVAPDLNGCFKPSISGSTLTASANRCDTVPIYSGSGSRFDIISSIDLTKTLSGLTVDSRYDIFIRRSGTGLALALGPAWTSSTSRGTGGGTTELVKQNGIYVNANAITGECGVKLCTYIATLLATSTTSGEIISGEYENLVVSGRFQPPRGTYSQLPTSPKDNDRFTVTDCATSTCDTGGGGLAKELRYAADEGGWQVWSGGGSGGSGSLQDAASQGRSILDAVDETTAVRIGNSVNPMLHFTDSLNRPRQKPLLPSDRIIDISTGHELCIAREGEQDCIFRIDQNDFTPVNVRSVSFNIDRAGGLADTDDRPKIFRVPVSATITQICATTDTGTSTINVQRNDGSAANILSSNLVAATSEACSTTFAAGENSVQDGHYLDFVMVQAATSGSPTQLTVSVKMTLVH